MTRGRDDRRAARRAVRRQRRGRRGRPGLGSSPAASRFTGWPRLGQAWLLDRELGRQFSKIVGGIPDEVTRGVYVTPTTNRSRAGRPDRASTTTTATTGAPMPRRSTGSWSAAGGWCRRSRPRTRIKVFAANRPAGDPVYRVERDERVTNLVQAAAIRSTGVSSSPAVAELVRDLLAEAGAPVGDDRRDAIRALEPVPRLLGHTRPGGADALDPRYGQVICACEQVTAAEIAAAFAMRVAPRAARCGAQAHARDRRPLPGRATAWPASRSSARAYGGLRPEEVWP